MPYALARDPVFFIGQGGILLLVDRALPGALPALLRPMVGLYPETVVLDGVAGLDQVPDGGVVVLCPRADEVDWMNLHRPLFARRALRVVLWSDAETTIALRRWAPDFFDWISNRVECPAIAPPHAVWGLRALAHARVVGAVYGDGSLREALAAAFPGRGVREVSARLTYAELVQAVHSAGRDLLVFTGANDGHDVRRVHWALSEARWRRPSLLVDAAPVLGWWSLHGRYMEMAEALVRLQGAARAGVLAALCGMEPEAIYLCAALLRHGSREEDLARELLRAGDPGAVVAQKAVEAGLVGLHGVEMGTDTPPLLRGLWCHPLVRQLRAERRARFLAAPSEIDAAVLTARLGPPLPMWTEPASTVSVFWDLADASHLNHLAIGDLGRGRYLEAERIAGRLQ